MALPRKASLKGAGKGISVDLERIAGLEPGSTLEVVSHGADGLLLLREGQAAQGYFAGSLGSLSLPEVFDHIVSSIRTGKLVVEAAQFRKTVSFRDGQITFATSTREYERLGEALIRLGLVSREELEQAIREVGPGRRLGQVLTGSGRISASSLYSAMTFLVREIVVGLFEITEGQFIFLEGPASGEDALKLPERTRELVLEGIKRGEDVLRLRKRLPPAMKVMRGPGPPAAERAELLDRVERGVPLSSLREHFAGSEYAFLSWVDELLRAGTLLERAEVMPAPEPPWSMPELRSTLDLYGEMVGAICKALRDAGKDLSPLQSFFQEPVPGLEQAFAGVTLSEEGVLDTEQVVKNTAGKGVARGRAQAYEALDAFISYAQFSARNVLSPELARSLAERLKHIREGGT